MKRIKVLRKVYQRMILRRPFTSFLITLALLFGAIVLANTVFKQKPTPTPPKSGK